MDSHCSFTSIKLCFNCFNYFQENLCFVTVEWWPSNAVPSVRISCKPLKYAWKYMSGYSPPEKYLCSPFVSQFWFYIKFLLVLLYFVCLWLIFMLIFWACILLRRLQIGMNFKISCYRNLQCLRRSAVTIHQACWTFLVCTTNGKSPEQCDKMWLAWSRGQHACLHKQQ